jgi:protein tyrosine phosphatase (PTP) superfamily phosphohydrolase (DUF442 family)
VKVTVPAAGQGPPAKVTWPLTGTRPNSLREPQPTARTVASAAAHHGLVVSEFVSLPVMAIKVTLSNLRGLRRET